MDEKRSCITINCGCCGPVSNAGNAGQEDGTPAGTIIAYMGTKAPKHYLVCDGGVYKIADFPVLSSQILDEFGAVNYFGGDGAETFAVPDLRNEFLRGYHGEAGEQLTGEVGRHQAPTSIPTIMCFNDSAGSICYPGSSAPSSLNRPINTDTMAPVVGKNRYVNPSSGVGDTDCGISYTTRPTNVAVLYCIKYE